MYTSAYVSIRQHTTEAFIDASKEVELNKVCVCVCIRQHTSAYVSIRQHTTEAFIDASKEVELNKVCVCVCVCGCTACVCV